MMILILLHVISLLVNISIGYLSILGEFLSQFIQTIYLPLPWQRVYVEMKEILISWFCINNKQIRKVLINSVTMLSTMFKVAAEKNTELQKKKCLSCISCTYLILVLNTVTIATTISYFLPYILFQQYCFICI